MRRFTVAFIFCLITALLSACTSTFYNDMQSATPVSSPSPSSEPDSSVLEGEMEVIGRPYPNVTGETVDSKDERIYFTKSDVNPGTLDDLQSWYDAIRKMSEGAKILLYNRSEQTDTLADSSVDGILGVLCGESVKPMEDLGERRTDGEIRIAAYDPNGIPIFLVSYDGAWLIIEIAQDGRLFALDGAGTRLSDLFILTDFVWPDANDPVKGLPMISDMNTGAQR